MSWQPVGAQTHVHDISILEEENHFQFEFNRSEGHVKVHYTITSRTLPASGGFAMPRKRYRIQFDTLEVVDDKEIGSGDWRIVAKVNGQPCLNTPEEHWSVGTGSEADLASFRSLTTNLLANQLNQITVYCRVQEEDS